MGTIAVRNEIWVITLEKGTYAIQVNRWTPRVKDQLRDRVICLVSN